MKSGQQNHQASLDNQALLEHHLQEKIRGHEPSFGWNLSQYDRQFISQQIRTLSTLQAQIHETRLSLMRDTKFENDLEFFSSAKKRNEAAYHLMESPFGKVIEESPKDLSVERYADRYRAKLKRDEIPDDAIAHDIAKQGISPSSPRLPIKSSPKESSFVPKDVVLDAARG